MKNSSTLLSSINEKKRTGQRLTFEDGVCLFNNHDLLAIGALALQVRERMHGRRVYYAVNLHLNPTNICTAQCEFCAFSRAKGEPGAYALSPEEIREKIAEAVRLRDINEIHMVGGHNPDIGLDYYAELFRWVREHFPRVHIKALSAPEIDDLAGRSGISIEEVLRLLKGAGLGTLPGGGAEIFEPRVRREICPKKISGARWLEIHRAAHKIGLPTNATMLYGHIENEADRVNHMLALRALQEETGGFRSFVPLAFQGPVATSGVLDLKVLSIARLILDNIPHIKVHWPATDLKFAQAALSFGADDIGGTNFSEQVLREAGSGAPEGLSSAELVRFIKDAGFEPCQVNSSYLTEKRHFIESPKTKKQ